MSVEQFPLASNLYRPIELCGRKLGVFILECPYDNLQDPFARNAFATLASFKIAGYRNEYPYGVLPVDTYDYIANHIVLCDLSEKSFRPIMGFKSVTLARCLDHHVSFPTQELLRGTGLIQHERAIQKIVDEYRSRPEQLAYNGSWTIDLEVRNNPELRSLCKDVTFALLVHYYRTYKIPQILAAAVTRFKVDRLKTHYGWEYLESDTGERLGNFPCDHFYGENLALLQWRKFSPAAEENAARFKALWDNRVTVGQGSVERKTAIAA